MRSGGMFQGKRVLPSPPIDFRQASQFKNEAAGVFKVATSVFGTGMASVTRGNQRTDPNVSVQGVDELYLDVSGLSLAHGRNFTLAEVQSGASIVMVGQSVVDRLFESWEDPVGQHVLVGSQRYSIVGILEARGTSFGRSQDNQILMPIQGVRRQYSDEGRSYNLTCTVAHTEDMPEAVEQATGWMRVVRGDAPGKPNSFLIRQSNRLVATLLEATDGITMVAVFIGLITLFGAGIGLMNIMLGSVSERTREIGTRKSLGATGAAIRTQFLAEVLVIGQLGGIVGISLGLVVGNLIANAFDTPFIVPWAWVVTGVLLCLVTSLASGYYPARLASKLDPIVALGRE